MTTPDLLPCPFCGGKPYLANVEMVGCSYVVCTDCRAQGDDMSKDRAIASWNTRAPAPELIRQAVEAERERLAQIGYRVCAETRHVTLGNSVAAAIRAGE